MARTTRQRVNNTSAFSERNFTAMNSLTNGPNKPSNNSKTAFFVNNRSIAGPSSLNAAISSASMNLSDSSNQSTFSGPGSEYAKNKI